MRKKERSDRKKCPKAIERLLTLNKVAPMPTVEEKKFELGSNWILAVYSKQLSYPRSRECSQLRNRPSTGAGNAKLYVDCCMNF